MRDLRFRYRFQCEYINKSDNKIENYFVSIVLSLNEIETRKFLREYKVEGGVIKILGVVAKDQFTGYLDENSKELFEGDKVMNEIDRVGHIYFRKGKWICLLEEDLMNYKEEEELELETHWYHLRKIGTMYGDDNMGELKKYDVNKWEDIL